ncbi:FAD-dependent oxidoreductase [Enterococcus xiangfangensis]|uniref:FAD-dependent oxidoreductase n=1 Tax=Enterococcus xiangfangensis TaxID=1296537 RepID=A0ABU3FCR1_9ENTE|nr:FAD-dependent oxidoreductase [Enterococcus xiangfangensis]MDT2760448.1 FAD-dependent oxidoreductase [Enterococcus xiangfangensis]
MKFVVIGGVAGGPSFATRLRRLNEEHEIVIYERGEDISYASCALPYYLGGVIDDLDSLIERTPEILKVKNNIDVFPKHEVQSIDPDKKQLVVKNLQTGAETTTNYDKLVISSGARPTLPPIEGANEATNGFILRSVTDAAEIKTYIDKHDPKSVLVLGAGVMGLELAENFKHRGLDVTLVDQLPQVAFPYDEEIADLIYDKLIENGLKIHLSTRVEKINHAGKEVVLSDGTILNPDLILFATGVAPNNEMTQNAGIKLAEDGQIIVNDQLETNVPDIYAIGDIIKTTSLVTGLATSSMLSSAANRQGHMLADIVNGTPMRYRGYIGAGVAKIFDYTASYAGMTEHALKAAGITNYKSIFVTPFDHAYFYPEAKRLNLKIIFDATSGKILGGQAVGEKGVDKRMGELSVAITGNLTVFDLPDLELPYSPPYSTTRDPLNIAGYVAINQMTNVVETIKAADIPAEDLATAFFLDIRETDKAKSGSIEASKNIPMNELRERINEIPRDRKVYITFRKGLNTYTSARILAGFGIPAILIEE